jgi:hypothetical protein
MLDIDRMDIRLFLSQKDIWVIIVNIMEIDSVMVTGMRFLNAIGSKVEKPKSIGPSLCLEWAGQFKSHTRIRPAGLGQCPITLIPPLGL